LNNRAAALHDMYRDVSCYLHDRLVWVVNKFHLVTDNFIKAFLTVRVPTVHITTNINMSKWS